MDWGSNNDKVVHLGVPLVFASLYMTLSLGASNQPKADNDQEEANARSHPSTRTLYNIRPTETGYPTKKQPAASNTTYCSASNTWCRKTIKVRHQHHIHSCSSEVRADEAVRHKPRQYLWHPALPGADHDFVAAPLFAELR